MLDSGRKAYYDDMLDFLEQKILESQKNKSSIDRVIFYNETILTLYDVIICLYIADIYRYTCNIDNQTIDKAINKLNGLNDLYKWYNHSIEAGLNKAYHLDKNQKAVISQTLKDNMKIKRAKVQHKYEER